MTIEMKDMGGKRVATWIADPVHSITDGGHWVYDPSPNCELEFLGGATIIALPPQAKKGKSRKEGEK